MIRAANHVRDAHVDVIHHHAELVSRQSVRAQQNEVFDLLILNFTRAKNCVFEFCDPGSWHEATNRVRLARLLLRSPLLSRQIAALARRAARSLCVSPGGFGISLIVSLARRRSCIRARILRSAAVASISGPILQ